MKFRLGSDNLPYIYFDRITNDNELTNDLLKCFFQEGNDKGIELKEERIGLDGRNTFSIRIALKKGIPVSDTVGFANFKKDLRKVLTSSNEEQVFTEKFFKNVYESFQESEIGDSIEWLRNYYKDNVPITNEVWLKDEYRKRRPTLDPVISDIEGELLERNEIHQGKAIRYYGEDILACPNGLYLVKWRDSEESPTSLACFGSYTNYEKWMVCSDWLKIKEPSASNITLVNTQIVSQIEFIELIAK